ncbi:hypothetical protein KKG83_04320 [Candidatus Micrarchaeota archaeon]|nr:hypothetical protein [Candidatus Micrarchaeota archaeon]MBU2476670.1 hypothetical protein [Candidatus Micrarchaeota archaeon]
MKKVLLIIFVLIALSACTQKPVCGNEKCEIGENNSNCPQDCPAEQICGNEICEAGENQENCPEDCLPATECGNGKCDDGENYDNCPQDCKTNETHFECINQECIEIQGTGTNQCTTNENCIQPTDILGEKKFAIVYAFQENLSDFDAQTYSEQLEDIANSYFVEASYGKMNIDIDFYTTIIPANDTGPCDLWNWRESIVDLIDPNVDLREYYGIITVYKPDKGNSFWSCSNHAGSPEIYSSEDGEVQMTFVTFKTQEKNGVYSSPSPSLLAHEIGHAFELPHHNVLFCKDESDNPVTIGQNYEGKLAFNFDPMGAGSTEYYSLRNSYELLGWLTEENVIDMSEVIEGEYWIAPINKQFTTTAEKKGIKIPILWDPEETIFYYHEENRDPFYDPIGWWDPPTHYYIEYRLLDSDIFQRGYGVFIVIGKDDWSRPTEDVKGFENGWLLNLHPGNSEICGDTGCEDLYFFLEENQTYYDQFNEMSVSVLSADESGALIDIKQLKTS